VLKVPDVSTAETVTRPCLRKTAGGGMLRSNRKSCGQNFFEGAPMKIDLNRKCVAQLVGKFMSWERVEERLKCYPEIRAHFEKHMTKSRSQGHHCHEMAWRLGTWSSNSERVFQRLEGLLAVAKTQPGWAGERQMFVTPQYGTFWSLVWQLQVAEWLVHLGFTPKWQNPGPDLLVEVGGRDVWVESVIDLSRRARRRGGLGRRFRRSRTGGGVGPRRRGRVELGGACVRQIGFAVGRQATPGGRGATLLAGRPWG